MFKKLLCTAGLLFGLHTAAQQCPAILSPLPGSTGVSVSASISWEAVEGVTGYRIAIGTTPGGDEVLPLTTVGAATTFTPPFGLPDDTQMYVSLYLLFLNQPDIACAPFSFTTEDVTLPPPCTALRSPVNGSTDIPVASNLNWSYSPTASGYRLAIGTSPGGSEILPLTDVGNVLSYNPPADFPAETTIYVRIVPYNDNGDADACLEEQFTTGPLATLPLCSQMVSPVNGESNVPLSPVLEWEAVAGADGYIVSIGTSPFDNDVLDNVRFFTNLTNVINFEPNRIYYIRIIPFNTAGEAIGCGQETFSTILGCGPYFDPGTGELVDLRPEIDFPELVGICLGDAVTTLSATGDADGYRWYIIDSPGRERLLAETEDFEVPGEGLYRYEAYRSYSGPSGAFECASSAEFRVTASEAPEIRDTDVRLGVGVISITTEVSGSGDYEFALKDPAGPYQDSNRFENLPLDTYTIHVRDKNGCGSDQVVVTPDLTVEGFPKFFTPNGDGTNDRWQYIVPESGLNPVREIFIFDRYGSLLAQIGPDSPGWDGTVNGRPLPPNNYWFRAVDRNGGEIHGHFVLKR